MRTLADLLADGDLRGKRVLVRSDLNVPLDGQTITDDGRIRASVPTIEALAEAGATVVVCAHLGRPKGAPEDRVLARPGRRRGSASCSGAPVAFATDTVGESAKATVAAASPRRRRAPGEPPVQPGRDEQGRRRAGRVRRAAGRARRRLRLRRLRRRAPQAGVGLRRRPAAAARRRRAWSRRRSTCSSGSPRTPTRPYAVVLGGAKVSDKLGVIGNLLGTADRLLIGGGMVFTFLKAQGHEVGKSLLEEDQLETVRGYLDEAAASGRRDRAAGRHRRGHRVLRRRRPRGRRRPTRSRPTGWAWTSARSPSELFAEKLERRADRVLERPDGRVRDGAVRGGHQGARRGARRGHRRRRADRRRRRRLGGRGAPARASPTTSSATSRPAAARASSTSRARSCPASTVLEDPGDPLMATPHAADRRQLEDEPGPPQATHLVQKLDWTLRDAKHDYDAVEVAVLPPFTDLRSVQTLVEATSCALKYGAQDLSAQTSGAYTGEISGALLAKLGCTYVGRRAQRAARVPRRVRRDRQRQGARPRSSTG